MNLILLLILGAVLGGFIAFGADRLGRTLGKKRLSIFGMRPRHTAELLTVGAGALIPLITIAFVMASSTAVRRWIYEGPNLIRLRDQAIQERDQAVKDIAGLNRQREQKTAEVSRVNERLKGVQKNLLVAEQRVKESNAKLASLESKFLTLTREYRSVGQQLRLAKGNLKDAQTRYAALDKTYQSLQKSFTQLHIQQKEVLTQNVSLIQENEKISAQVEKGNQDLSRLKEEMTRQQKEFDLAQAEYNKSLKAAADDLERMQANLQDVQHRFAMQFGFSRVNSMMFERLEEVAREVVPPGQDAVHARAAFDSLMRKAYMSATERGAKPQTEQPTVSIAPNAAKEDAIVEQITNSHEELLLIAVSTINVFQGEPVWLSVASVANPLVFKKGQKIAETHVNGRLAERDIYKQIMEFLQTDVQEEAKRANMILTLRREPTFTVDEDEIRELAKVIHLNNHSIKLVALADGETRAGGPLKLQFRLQ